MDEENNGPPKFYFKIKEKFPKLFEGYEKMSKAAHEEGNLSKKYRYLVKLGIAIGMGHEKSIRVQVKKSLENGAEIDEIIQSILLSTSMVGFSRMMGAIAVAEKLFKEQGKTY